MLKLTTQEACGAIPRQIKLKVVQPTTRYLCNVFFEAVPQRLSTKMGLFTHYTSWQAQSRFDIMF